MQFRIIFTEVVCLSILFTALAIYFDIHGERHVLTFIINHVIALLIALIISKFIHIYMFKNK
jgi:hypothetical protein